MARIKNLISFLDGFRKLSVMLLLTFITLALLLADVISADNYTKILIVITPAYFAANVGEHATNRIKEWIQTLKKR